MPLPVPSLLERFDRTRADRVQRELRDALARLPPGELAAWGRRASRLLREAGVRRAVELLRVGGGVLRWSRDEAVALGQETRAGRGLAHLSQRWRALREGSIAAAAAGRDWLGVTARALREDPRNAAPRLAASVLGAFVGSGNAQVDRAMTGVDIARNLGKPAGLAGDVVAGAMLEAGASAMIDLARLLLAYLPAERDPLWDRLAAGHAWVTQALQGAADAPTPPPLPPPHDA